MLQGSFLTSDLIDHFFILGELRRVFCHVSGRFSRMAKDTIVDVCCAVEFSLSQVAEVTVFLLEMLDALSDFIL